MIDELINKVVELGIREKRIPITQKNIYLYGYTVLFETSISMVCSLLIAALFSKIVELLAFFTFFIPLRSYGGGYHSKSSRSCVLLSILLIVIFCILIGNKTIVSQNLLFLNVTIMGTAMVFLFAPRVKYVEKNVERYCKITVSTIFSVGIIIAGLLFIYNIRTYSMCILLAQISWLISLIIGILSEKYLAPK